jgi:hypothetical protein
MADSTEIEWADSTWNPVTGCTKITAGCDHCYAERFSERFRGVDGHPFERGFDLTLRPERLLQPLKWRQPRRIFVNSMSDLFHKEVPTAFIDAVFDTMEQASWHTYQVLTKRSSLMARYLRRRFTGELAHLRQLLSDHQSTTFAGVVDVLLPMFLLRETNVKDVCVNLAKEGFIENTWGGGNRKPVDSTIIRRKPHT